MMGSMSPGSQGGEDAVLAELAEALLDDRKRGRERTLAAYLAMFPGYEEAVRREYLAQHPGGTAAVQRSIDDAGLDSPPSTGEESHAPLDTFLSASRAPQPASIPPLARARNRRTYRIPE
jgi:hypothetical protein